MPNNNVGSYWTPCNEVDTSFTFRTVDAEVDLEFAPRSQRTPRALRFNISPEMATDLLRGYGVTPSRQANPTPINRERVATMQVLLPHTSFKESATALVETDVRRNLLGVLRILKTLKTLDYNATAINRHPSYRWLKMWHKHEGALAAYGLHLIEAAGGTLRHFRGAAEFLHAEWDAAQTRNGGNDKPEWVYTDAILESHRQYLTLQQERDRLRVEFKRARKPNPRVHITGILSACHNLRDFVTRVTGSHDIDELSSGRVSRAREHLRQCVTAGRTSVVTRENAYAEMWGGPSSLALQFPEN